MARWKIIYKWGFTAGIFCFALNGKFPLAMSDYRGVPPKIDRMCVYVVGCDWIQRDTKPHLICGVVKSWTRAYIPIYTDSHSLMADHPTYSIFWPWHAWSGPLICHIPIDSPHIFWNRGYLWSNKNALGEFPSGQWMCGEPMSLVMENDCFWACFPTGNILEDLACLAARTYCRCLQYALVARCSVPSWDWKIWTQHGLFEPGTKHWVVSQESLFWPHVLVRLHVDYWWRDKLW